MFRRKWGISDAISPIHSTALSIFRTLVCSPPSAKSFSTDICYNIPGNYHSSSSLSFKDFFI